MTETAERQSDGGVESSRVSRVDAVMAVMRDDGIASVTINDNP